MLKHYNFTYNFTLIIIVILFGMFYSYTVLAQEENSHKQYLSIIVKGIPEIDAPQGRWPYKPGSPLIITYRYDDSINTHPEWHAAFWDAREDWDNLNTPTNFDYDANSLNTLGVINNKDEPSGITEWTIQGGVIVSVKVAGNQYWDNYYSYTVNQRRSTAAHEIGHLQGVGHIPRGDPDEDHPHEAIMWSWRYLHEKEWLYSPRLYDRNLINQVYP